MCGAVLSKNGNQRSSIFLPSKLSPPNSSIIKKKENIAFRGPLSLKSLNLKEVPSGVDKSEAVPDSSQNQLSSSKSNLSKEGILKTGKSSPTVIASNNCSETCSHKINKDP